MFEGEDEVDGNVWGVEAGGLVRVDVSGDLEWMEIEVLLRC